MSNLNQINGVAALKKHDMRVSTIVFMIYCLVAAGAFGIEEMIPTGGPGLTIVMLLVFPLIWALPISNIVAEMGSILPSEGGAYVWVREALGEFWGFQAGWFGTVSTYITSGTYVVLVVNYVGRLYEMSDFQAYMIKIAMILAFTIINLMGMKEVGKVSTILSMIVLVAFAVVAIIGFVNWNYNPFTPFIPQGQGILQSVGGSVSVCIWMYCGYECISNMAGEVDNPQVIPKGLIIAMPLIALTYVLPTIAGLASLGHWQDWATEGQGIGYMNVFTKFLGPSFGMVFLIVAVIAQCAIYNTYLASGSRGFFVMADDNLSPKILVKVSKKRGTPYVGIITLAVVTIILAQFEFETLVKSEVVFILALYILLSISALVLRKKIPISQRDGRYVIPGGKLGIYTFCGLPFVIAVVALLINGTDYFIIGMLAISTGPLAYIIIKRIYGGRYMVDPVQYPINPRTKLAVGDVTRLSLYCVITGVFSFVGSFFLTWYEGKEATTLYLEEYGNGFFSNFDSMITVLKWGGIVIVLFGSILWFIASKTVSKTASKTANKTACKVENEIVLEEANI